MKKHSIVTLMAIAAIAFFTFSCKNEDLTNKNEIIAKDVLYSIDNIATVKALVEDPETWDEVEIASCKYENDGFKLKLPKTVSDEYLFEIDTDEEVEEWVTVSDPKAKLSTVWFFGYNEKGKEIGTFYHMGYNMRYYASAVYIYSDRKFTIKGTYEDEDEYSEIVDCKFNKGWNVLYIVEQEYPPYQFTVTTQKPSEVKMEWIFDQYYHWEDGKGDVKKSLQFRDIINKLKLSIQNEKSKQAKQ